MSKTGWKDVIYGWLFVIVMIIFLYFFIGKPEENGIQLEKERLEKVEQKVVSAIEQKDYEKAKVLLIQLRWQHHASTAGGSSETDDLKKVWDEKHKEYLQIIDSHLKNPGNTKSDHNLK
jgi:hypothetical protein